MAATTQLAAAAAVVQEDCLLERRASRRAKSILSSWEMEESRFPMWLLAITALIPLPLGSPQSVVAAADMEAMSEMVFPAWMVALAAVVVALRALLAVAAILHRAKEIPAARA